MFPSNKERVYKSKNVTTSWLLSRKPYFDPKRRRKRAIVSFHTTNGKSSNFIKQWGYFLNFPPNIFKNHHFASFPFPIYILKFLPPLSLSLSVFPFSLPQSLTINLNPRTLSFPLFLRRLRRRVSRTPSVDKSGRTFIGHRRKDRRLSIRFPSYRRFGFGF